MAERDWAAAFRETFAAPVSPVEARVGHAVFGDDYPEELEPHSFITRSELRRFAAELRVGPGETLVDAGCGRGGPGLWVAAQTGANLISLDIADTAIAAAAERAHALGLQDRFAGRVGTFEDTGLHDDAADALMSVDALLFTPDKRRALYELARVLRVGGRLVFTSWDYRGQPAGRPPQVDDHRPLLDGAGFDVLAYEETDDWRARLQRHSELLLEAVDELATEFDEDPATLRAELTEEARTTDVMIRRCLVVAQRR